MRCLIENSVFAGLNDAGSRNSRIIIGTVTGAMVLVLATISTALFKVHAQRKLRKLEKEYYQHSKIHLICVICYPDSTFSLMSIQVDVTSQ